MEGPIPLPQIIFEDISESDYYKLFSTSSDVKTGAGFEDIAVFEPDNYSNIFRRNNRAGAGLFSILSTVAKKSYPFLKRYILPEALTFGSNLLERVNKNQSISREDIKNLAKTSVKNVANRAFGSSGSHRKYVRKKSKSKSKRSYRKKVKNIKRRKIKKKRKSGKKIGNGKKSKRSKKNYLKNSIFNDM